MGRINACKDIEVIPIDTEPAKSANNSTKMIRNVILTDPTIIPRVQKYLEANLNNRFIDINVMAHELQKKYAKEYGNRKRSAFRALVKKAYGILMNTYGEPKHDSDSDEVSDESDGEVHFPQNAMNNQLLDMYTRQAAPKPLQDNELIDISSDDSNDDEPGASKSANGASTSNKRPLDSGDILGGIPKSVPSDVDVFHSEALERAKKRRTELGNVTTLASSALFNKKKKVTSVASFQEPKVAFKDIGGMDKVLSEVCKLLVHMKHPEIYRLIGIAPPRGFLLHGPPGCGKTLLANAISGELEIPLLKVSAPELVAGVSGESEERIRELFEKATVSAPCILFIDEIDAITPNRQFAQKEMERRIVAQLLTCLDDLSKNETGDQVLIIGATNRPDSLDPALRRAGRFDREVCLGIPDAQARMSILKVLTSGLKLEDNFNYESLAAFTPGFVGADLMALIREAAMTAVNRVFNDLKEKLRLNKAVAAQKAAQAEAAKETITAVTSSDSDKKSTGDKDEPEIVVDVDETKSDAGADNGSDAGVLIIDDEISKPEPSPPLKQQKTVEETVEQAPSRELTPLEELISWLHNSAPLNADQLNNLYITNEDFAKALKCVQPSAKREGFATVPDVTWNDIGSLKNIREELQLAILAPVRHAEQFKSLGLTAPTGVMLCGPPGCGKTLLAKAIANEAGVNFISVKGPELLNMYVGESERAVRLCFERARNSAPCVIFFDELDALCPKRSDSREGGATMRVVNQMLTEMDGVESRNGVYLLAATNRPDIVDPAILRPGRLDKILYVGLPSPMDRVDILKTITKNGTRPTLATDVDLESIGKSDQCNGYTGADLAALVREASVQAFKEVMVQGNPEKPVVVSTEHFAKAVSSIRPSVTEKDQQHYDKLKKIYSAKQPEVEAMEMDT